MILFTIIKTLLSSKIYKATNHYKKSQTNDFLTNFCQKKSGILLFEYETLNRENPDQENEEFDIFIRIFSKIFAWHFFVEADRGL